MCVGECKDPFVTYLKSFGYNALQLPRANVSPLQVLAKSGKDLNWLGDLSDVFNVQTAEVLPLIERDVVASSISGQRSGEVSIGVGLSLLGGVISALGGSKVGLDVGYKRATSAVFEFPEVLSDTVSVVKLDRFLGASDVNPNAVSVGKMLEADQIFVITSTIKSRKYTVVAKDKSGVDVAFDVPVIQNAVGGDVKVSAGGDRTGKVTYEGATPLVFGFQAVQLFYEKGAYTAFEPVAAGTVTARGLGTGPGDGAKRLITESGFAALRLD